MNLSDDLIFYKKHRQNQEISFLAIKVRGQSHYSFINYEYSNPFDDSSIVNLFKRDFGNQLIHPNQLLSIVKKTQYPHFLKEKPNGLIYLIKIEDDNQHHGMVTKWFPIGKINAKMSSSMKKIIDEYHLFLFIKNQYLSDHYGLSDREMNLMNRLFCSRTRKQMLIKERQKHWSMLVESQTNYLKTLKYKDLEILYHYTGRDSLIINQTCRQFLNSKITKCSKEMTINLKKIITILSVLSVAPQYGYGYRYLNFYRGLSFDPQLKIGDLTDLFKFNFNSASLDLDLTVNMFVPQNGSLFKLILPCDISFLCLHLISQYSHEDEMLLPPGLTFRVIDRQKQHNAHLKIDQIYYKVVLHDQVMLLDHLNQLHLLGKIWGFH